ncbi:hypothetical protein B0H13DRAFT_2679786 [Mycena leptocephala]|nr:hypothetical protein B0H13DRAFT_2679786 [Mycena leptocephala]
MAGVTVGANPGRKAHSYPPPAPISLPTPPPTSKPAWESRRWWWFRIKEPPSPPNLNPALHIDNRGECSNHDVQLDPTLEPAFPPNYDELPYIELPEPRTAQEALNSPQSNAWAEAMEEEINQLEKANAWDIVKPPLNANVLRSRYVFRTKHDSNNEINRY